MKMLYADLFGRIYSDEDINDLDTGHIECLQLRVAQQ